MSRRCSQTAALRRIRVLGDADAGRLVGRCLRYTDSPPVPPGTLDPDAAALLHASVYRPRGAPVTADMIFYVVSVDGTPVAWLTYHAAVVTPPARLTPYQCAQQARAVAALNDLSRRAVRELAALRDARERREPGGAPDPLSTATQLLVADPADPTLTYWTRITPGVTESLEHLRAVTGADGDVLVVEAYGYGDYGRHCEVFDLPVLCAIEALAVAHGLPAAVVGDWLDAEGASRTLLTAGQVAAAFAVAFAGVHGGRLAFAEAEVDRRGWAIAWRAAGIPERFFDTRAFAEALFADEVHAVAMPDYRIAVFRRGNHTAAEPKPESEGFPAHARVC